VCTVTPHCGDMKRLWRHLQGCRDHRCMVLHCVSSRAILSHYRNCQNQFCPSCSPVRAVVANSKCIHDNAAGGHQRSLSRNNGFHANGPVLHNKDHTGHCGASMVMPTRVDGNGGPSIVIPSRAVPAGAGAATADSAGSSPGGRYNANGLSTAMPPPLPIQQREQQIMATSTASAAAAAASGNAPRDQAENAELKKENAELKRKVAELMMENHRLQQENARYTRGAAC
jgi:hypothetical protein